MENKPFNDLFQGLDNGELPLSYLFIARLNRESLPELAKRDRQKAYASRHNCSNLPIIGSDILRNSVWWDGDFCEEQDEIS
ncbi:hypothetical protein [Neolewinella agarilytica]|uniref:Uncharacterized protein n=1 Tax=Neolewinella agarilytica TaxID=478744 RepID=A0A1H9AIY4_9BACT|nr:hypothetical protein [Neolewinella agarilytica]SEP76704.1 hypothetical protein SAMN05444359_102119 [Neolewinella agarilytica]